MQFYLLDFYGLKRELPILSLGPKIKIASVNFLGDRELVNMAAKKLSEKIKDIEFDYLVGPEATVLPLIHELSNIFGHSRYVICRKGVKGYMVKPIKSDKEPSLVLNGIDAEMIRSKKVIIVDDVVTSGKTIKTIKDLLLKVDSKIVMYLSIFKQGDGPIEGIDNFIYLQEIPVFNNLEK